MSPGPVHDNLLLAALPAPERERLGTLLARAELARGDVLGERDVPLRHVYFPTTAVVSLLAADERSPATEIALTGREGAVGLGLVFGGRSPSASAVVHVAGDAWRMPAATARAEFERSEPFRHLLLGFAQARTTQIGQAVVCNRHHSVDQALCRWLLLVRDRVGSDELHVTQQLIADALGVRREAIVEAAGKLQALGGIRYTRGVIHIVERRILAARSCGCYAVVTEAFEDLLGSLRTRFG
jgi:CRP-like cAMP-binding protein